MKRFIRVYDMVWNALWTNRGLERLFATLTAVAIVVGLGLIGLYNYFGPSSQFYHRLLLFFPISIVVIGAVNLAILRWPVVFATRAAVLGLAAAEFVLFSWISVVVLDQFGSGAYDFAIFSQAIWLIGQGKEPYSTLMGIHYMGDQMHYVFYLLGWIYRFVVEDVRVLLYAQSAALAFAALPLYDIARHFEVDRRTAAIIASAYLLSPIIWGQPFWDFHTDSFIVPALATAYWAALKRRWILFSLAIWLALSSKFLFAIPVVCFGLFLTIQRTQRVAGAFTVIVGLWHFVMAAGIIMPAITHSEQANIGRFGYLGSNMREVLVTTLTRPWIPLAKALDLESLRYYALLLAPIIPFFWMRPRSVIPLIGAAGIVGLNALSVDAGLRTFNYHYQVPVVVFLYFSLIWLVKGEDEQCAPARILRIALLPWALLVLTYQWNPVGVVHYLATYNGPFETTRKIVAAIPPSASVLTDHKLATRISMREGLYLPEWTVSPYYDLGDVDFIAFDLGHEVRSSPPDHIQVKEMRRLIEELGQNGPAEQIAPALPDNRLSFVQEVGCGASEEARRAASGLRMRIFARQPWTIKKDFSQQVGVEYVADLNERGARLSQRYNQALLSFVATGKFVNCLNVNMTLRVTYRGGVRLRIGPNTVFDDWDNTDQTTREIPLSGAFAAGKHFSLEYRNANNNELLLDVEAQLQSGTKGNVAWIVQPHRFVPIIQSNDAFLWRRIDYQVPGVKSEQLVRQPSP